MKAPVVLLILITLLAGNVFASEKRYGYTTSGGKQIKKESQALADFSKRKQQQLDNPHNDLECTDCHKTKPRKSDTIETVTFKNNHIDLCLECHSAESNIHPVGVIPTFEVPEYLPLDEEGRNTCVTCHDLHAEDANSSLLRGFDEGLYVWRTDLCYDCHGASFSKKNPHRTQFGKRKCPFCHTTEPEISDNEKSVQFKVAIFTLCDFCHDVVRKSHPLNVDLSISPPASLPRDADGNVTCATCHDPHGTDTTVHYLREDYVLSLQESKFINPHYDPDECKACHLTRPALDAKPEDLDYKYNGNFIALCNSCHGIEANMHPVNITPPPSMTIPDDLPLNSEGQVTCVTCHDPGVNNRKMIFLLRKITNEDQINELCFNCHDREKLKRFNPHYRMREERKCMFCHITPPDAKRDTSETVKIKGSIKLLCIRCHSYRPHPANFKHLRRPSMIVPRIFPLSREGKITCTTCHDPHIGGKKGKNHRLRENFKCKICHVNL